MAKKIIVSVTNDLTTDQRVAKICNTLMELNYEVVLVGRKRTHSKTLSRPYKTKRFRLWFNKGPLFYTNYSIRLYWYLLFSSFDVLWSNDLDTLWPNYAISKLKGKQLVFDSHEYFTEVPELVNRKKVQRFWKRIEQRIMPKLNTVFTVSQSIADLYEEEYGIKVLLLRNVPELKREENTASIMHTGNNKVIIYQGAINLGRGIELMVQSMQHCNNATLYLLGKGDIEQKIKRLIKELGVQDKVKMLGEIPHEQLSSYTKQAHLGLSLEEDLGLNYRYALPNKLFNYIHAGVPCLVSNLPEMGALVGHYEVGEIAHSASPKQLADQINSLLQDQNKLAKYKTNCARAACELNWEKEKQVILDTL